MARQPPLIGLDLSDLVLRAVTLSRGPKPRLEAFQEVLLPPGLITEGEIQRVLEVAGRIRTLLQHADPSPIRRTFVVGSLPDRRTFVKLITLPEAPSSLDVEAAIRQQVSQHIPFSAEDVYLDWQPVPVKGSRPAYLVGAAPKPLVTAYLEALEAAGLTVIGLEMESVALARAVLPEPWPTPATFVMDLGGTRTTVVAVARGVIQFAANLPFSGNLFTQTIARELRLSFTDAEKLKVLYGLSRTKGRGTVSRCLNRPLADLVRKLFELQRFLANHFPEAGQLESCVVTGGGARLTGFPEYLANELKVSVVLGDPTRHLQRPTIIPIARLPSFTTAIGLALRRTTP